MFLPSVLFDRVGEMNGCQLAPVEAVAAAERVVLVVEDEVVLRMAVCAHFREAGSS